MKQQETSHLLNLSDVDMIMSCQLMMKTSASSMHWSRATTATPFGSNAATTPPSDSGERLCPLVLRCTPIVMNWCCMSPPGCASWDLTMHTQFNGKAASSRSAVAILIIGTEIVQTKAGPTPLSPSVSCWRTFLSRLKFRCQQSMCRLT